MIHLVCKPELSTCGHVHNVPVVPYMKYLDVHVVIVIVPVVAVEGVVVLKEVTSCTIFCTVSAV